MSEQRQRWTAQILELLKKTVSELPEDVQKRIHSLPESGITKLMKASLQLSARERVPICQDTGFPYFFIQLAQQDFIHYFEITQAVREALVLATQEGFLRPNAVHPLTNLNPGNNLGAYLPYIEWELQEGEFTKIQVLLKGGGSENVSGQYSLPFSPIKAGRDLKGIVNTVLFHLQEIQGKGCSPGILGIGIGGDRSLSMKLAKKQLFRSLDDTTRDKDLLKIEEEILDRGNKLEIGPMGLGGSPTLLAVKAGLAARHPASFFVSIAYLCWVARRGECLLNTH